MLILFWYEIKLKKFMNTGIILRIRYCFYSSVGIISFALRKIFFSFYKFNKYKHKHNRIAVLGRGNSANKYFDQEYKLHSKVFIANYVNRDFIISDYLKILNKELVLVYNICEEIPYFLLLFFFIKINEIIISQSDKLISEGLRVSTRGSYRLNMFGVKVRGVRESEYINIFSNKREVTNITTGLYAIYEAAEFALRNNIFDISLYGFDLYSGPLNKNTVLRDEFDGKYTEDSDEYYWVCREDYLALSKSLDYIISKYPKIFFSYHTTNPYKFKSDNIKKYNFEY